MRAPRTRYQVIQQKRLTQRQQVNAQPLDEWQVGNAEDELLTALDDKRHKALCELEKLHGPKAAQALKLRATVYTDKEAAKLAGISDRSYQTYKAKLKSLLGECK